MMYQKSNISEDALRQLDLQNTLDGGSALPQIEIQEEDDYYVLAVRVPGGSPDNYKVEIENHQLHIYYWMTYGQDEKTGETKRAPQLVSVTPIPREVDRAGISAHTEGEIINIVFPSNEPSGGYSREVDIEHL